MKYNYIAVYNADIFEWVYRYNFIVMLNDRYELVSHCSHFGHNNCHFSTVYQHIIHLIHEKHIVCRKITSKDHIQSIFGTMGW